MFGLLVYRPANNSYGLYRTYILNKSRAEKLKSKTKYLNRFFEFVLMIKNKLIKESVCLIL